MKDPQRLLDGGGSGAELTLLRAANDEEPSELGRQRLAAALGVVLSVSTTATAAAATQAGASAIAKTTSGAKLATHWVLALVTGAVIGGAAVAYLVSRPVEKTPLVVSTVPPAEIAAKSPEPPAPAAQGEAAGIDPEALEQEAPTTARSPRTVESSRSEGGSIKEETAAIDEARRALNGGDARKSLSLLNDYNRKYPRGVFRQEATWLRIQALEQSGDHAGAKRLGEKVLAGSPNGPYAKRIRAIIGQ